MVHLGAVGPGYETQPSRDKEPGEWLKTWWDAGGFAWFAHPYWSNDSTGLLEKLSFLPAFEVYNHSCEYWNGKGFSPAHWDRVLSQGKPLLGLAVDDAHHEKGSLGGWVMVKSPALDAASILAALRRGDFYASCGPRFESITLEESGKLSVRCSPVQLISLYSEWGGGVMLRPEDGRPLTEATLDLEWFRKTDYFTFVRVECVDEQGHRAWSQALLKKPTAKVAD
jgi:hypothetical protein